MATRRRRNGATSSERPLRFNKKLVLNQWLLSLFEVESFAQLSDNLKSPDLERYDENNVSLFLHQLTQRLFQRGKLNNQILLGYDENIFKHTYLLNERRREPIRWKYFQYLLLLFSEIYLDRFFSDKDRLLTDLNDWVANFNSGKKASDQISSYEPDDLRKVAVWSATGSGKTLLMHVNILQYSFYLEKHGRQRDMNRIILLTPNEGLSRQHLQEFQKAGMPAELFNPDNASLFAGQTIEIIDIHKLAEQKGEKTVAVESFETNNLVLVDEGHRGAGGEIWKDRRSKLCERGFSFEYSATFSQAVAAAGNETKKKLTNEYAKAILIDYSYRHFFHDGYGKEYRILNLAEERSEEARSTYLAACLLAFYQQLCIFETKREEFGSFLLEEPLWIFVGGSVTKEISTRDVSDVIEILRFLKDFLTDSDAYKNRIGSLLRGTHELLDISRHLLFQNTFTYLIESGMDAQAIYDDVLRRVFNTLVNGVLHIEELKGAAGEVALRVGIAEPFGVINVGDATKLCKKCGEHGFEVSQKEFSGSLFEQINKPGSAIKVLIGSKKFSEGWSSWRVSTMGLMHVGRGEGSQIIQLFGRGVRLKGYNFGLKRSSRIEDAVDKPKYIREVESLNVFGIKADYMEEFKKFLEEEGLPTGEETDEIILPTFQTLPSKDLKILKLPDNLDFRRDAPKPILQLPKESLVNRKVVLDWYPKIQARMSQGLSKSDDVALPHEGHLEWRHRAFLNWDKIYFELINFKNERGWFNLNISRDSLQSILADPTWYVLKIPAHELAITDFKRVRVWEEIATALLKKYAEMFYKAMRGAWEGPRMIYADLDSQHDNFVAEYRFVIDQSEQDIRTQLNEVKAVVDQAKVENVAPFGKWEAIFFRQHLFQPLIYLKSAMVKVYPVHLNEGERDFIVDLKKFYQGNPSFFANRELYVMRNRSKRGIGFFEADNFYPDFILWLVEGDKQFVSFIDPKGLRNLDSSLGNAKIQFHKKIKELEKRDLDPNIVLNSFIVSRTKFNDPGWWTGSITKEQFESQNVFFQLDDREVYVSRILNKIR